jgi:hypothetical protein
VSEKLSNPKDIVGSNKVPLHLFPTTAIALGAMAFLEGAVKYGRSNFREVGVRSSIYYDAARRHLDSWFEGEDIDPDSGIDHLGKALACIAVLIDAKAADKLNDDRMVQGGYGAMMAQLTPLVAEIKARHADKSPKHYTIADNAPPLMVYEAHKGPRPATAEETRAYRRVEALNEQERARGR